MNNPNEELPYRAPVTAPTRDEATENDDQDYSTLVEVKKTLDGAIEALYKDFNAFDVLSEKDPEAAAKNLLNQIDGKQIAFNILVPLQSTIDSAVQAVIQKRKGNNG